MRILRSGAPDAYRTLGEVLRMKLAVICDEISMDFEHALDVMGEYGVKSVELRSLWGSNIGDLTDEQAERVRAAVQARGMSVCCLASPFFKCDLEGDEGGATGRVHQATERGLAGQMELLDRLIRFAKFFETDLIRVFAFWRHGDMTEDIERRIVEAFAEPAAIAEKAGVILALENEHACYLGGGVETARVLDAIDSPAVRGLWDPGNAFCTGYEVPFPDGYEAMKPRLVHVHVKDPVLRDGRYGFVRMGEGDIDYMAQFRALKADGYSGYISLETHYKPDNDSEKGSRQCLESLNRMLSEL